MLRKFTKFLLGKNQGNSGNNNNNSAAPTNQLAKNPAPIALLIEDEIPDFTLTMPKNLWVMPPLAKNKNEQEVTIATYLTPRDKKTLSQTNTEFYSLYKEESAKQRNYLNTLFNIKNDKPYDKEDLRKLLSHAALGEWEQAEEIWSQDPSLLTRYGTVYHPNRIYQKDKAPIDISNWQNPGRYKYVDCTAWQIALMNEEYEEAEKMGEFMTEEEKRRQFAEAFPNGNIEKYNNDFEKAKQLLEAVFDAITHDSIIDEDHLERMNEDTRKALQDLYDFVKPAPEHKTGLVFDANIYMEALRLYEDKFEKFIQYNLWDGPHKKWDRRSFWCIRIEEYLAALLGTAYLSLHAKRIYNIEEMERNGCKLVNGSSYFPFRRPSDSIPGFHFFVGYYRGNASIAKGERAMECFAAPDVVLSKLMLSKNDIRDRVMQQYSHQATSRL